MDPDRRDEADYFLRNASAIPNQPAYFDGIPGVDIFGRSPIPSPTVIQNVAAPGGGNPIAPRLSTSTEGAREEGIVLAPVRAQALDFSYSEEEDYGCDGEDAAPTEVPESIEEEVAHLRADVWTSITGT